MRGKTEQSAPLALSQLILSILNKLIVPPALLFTAAVLPLVTVDGAVFLFFFYIMLYLDAEKVTGISENSVRGFL